MSNHLIDAQSIHVSRHGQAILRDVSLQVDAHDFVTVIGPNGAGKTVLLKCLMGFYPPDAGSIARVPGLRIGYVPQRLNPEPTIPISVKRFLRLRSPGAPEALHEAAALCHIEGILRAPLWSLSGGELQRVLLARALMQQPQLLILDEPAQNLDVSGQLAFYQLLDKLYTERGLSILMVSHDLHLVMASSRRVVCLFQHICCAGEPQQVAKDPEFIALFGHDMARMMAVYHHHHDHDHEHHGHSH